MFDEKIVVVPADGNMGYAGIPCECENLGCLAEDNDSFCIGECGCLSCEKAHKDWEEVYQDLYGGES